MKTLVYGASIKGNGHYATGTVCQDSNSFSESDFSDDEIKVVSLSDGHGGTPYFRSAIGSRKAADISKKALYEFIKAHKDALDKKDAMHSPSEKKKGFLGKIAEKSSDKKELKSLEEDIKKAQSEIDYLKPIIEFKKAKANKKDAEAAQLIKKLSPSQKEYEESDSYSVVVTIYNKFVEELNQAISRKQDLLNGAEKPADATASEDSLNAEAEILRQSISEDLSKVKEIIVKEWNEAIDQHLSEHPVDIATIEMYKVQSVKNAPKRIAFMGYAEESPYSIKMVNKELDQKMTAGVLRNPRQMYGATLLCAGCYKNHVFILQIGDGDITVVDKDGKVAFPVTKPENQIANETNSICQANALSKFSEIYFEKPIKMIMLSTDGVTNALDSETELGNLALGIYESIEEEPKTFREDFKPLLRRCSEASSDDCTICFIANDIDDKDYDTIKKSDEVPESNDLDKTYIPKFNTFKADQSLYPVEEIAEDRPIDLQSKIKFSQIEMSTLKAAYLPLKEEFEDIVATKDEVAKLNWTKGLLLKLKTTDSDLLDVAEKEAISKLLVAYKEQLDGALAQNPIVIGKIDVMHISLDEEFRLKSENKETRYAFITSLEDSVISFVEITKGNYDKISSNFASCLGFNGKIKINEQHSIEINKENISLK